MSVSDNYTPQSENLNQLNKVLGDLHDITKQNTALKNRIFANVNLIVKDIEGGNSSNKELVDELNFFLSRLELKEKGSTSKRSNGSTESPDANNNQDESKTDEQKELDQNKRLKAILEQKQQFLACLRETSKEYEEGIDTLLSDIEKKNSITNMAKLKSIEEYRTLIYKAQDEEWREYEEYIKKQDMIYELARVLRTFYQNTEMISTSSV